MIGDIIEVKIEKILPRGVGLAFADGLTIFVPLAAPGDRLRVRVVQIKGKIAYAEIEEIIEPSKDRIEPPCVYFGACGGCDFQQMNYAAQLEAKVGIIRDCLHRIAKIELSEPHASAGGQSERATITSGLQIIPSPSEFGYRSRAQWHLDTDREKIGYYKRGSRELVDIEQCLILTPELQKILEDVRRNPPEGVLVDAAHGSDGQVSIHPNGPRTGRPLLPPSRLPKTAATPPQAGGEQAVLTELGGDISFTACGERYFYSAETFFQANHSLVEKLIETTLEEVGGETALDLYCGVGLFTIQLARKFGRVIGVEEDRQAIRFVKRNAEYAELDNVEFHTGSVREFLNSGSFDKPDFVLLDPPRAGVEKRTVQSVIELRPREISYVSCEPAGMARDLRRFLDRGYSIQSITALDMFPQTHHVETVVRLKSEPPA